MRSKFDAQLRELGEKLTLMGAMCEEAIANSAKALLSGDSELAKKLAPLDLEIDQYERDIETLCLRLLLQQQPVARDLRQISAALKMITDLERIGDQASDIAEIIPHLKGRTGSECQAMRPMAEAAIGMVTDSIEAYNKRDLALAKSVIEHDDVVDDCFLSVKTALIDMSIAAHSSRQSSFLTFCIFCRLLFPFLGRNGACFDGFGSIISDYDNQYKSIFVNLS